MFLRISSLFAALVLLAGCGAESPPPPGDKVDCAIGGEATLAPVCTLEKVAGRREFVIHHPDGGFRRFARDPGTAAIAPMDGAAPLVLQVGEGGALAFTVEADRYSIPRELLTAGPE